MVLLTPLAVVVVVAAVFRLLLATTLRFATFWATVPNGVGTHIQVPDGMVGIVTMDLQFAPSGYLLRRLVLNHDIQTGTRPECSWKGIVD